MTNTDFHARRTELSNTFAAAGARLLDYMRCAGALAAIPNTQQYVVAGDPAAIRAQLDTVDPQRRMRHGDRPEQPLYFGPEAGQPRRWAALITSAGHGVLQEYGSKFEHAQPGQEVLEVMEILPGAPATANKAAEEGERMRDEYKLPALPDSQEFVAIHENILPDNPKYTQEAQVRAWDDYYTADQVRAYARQAIAADRASRQVANKAEVEPVGVIVADDPVHGWYMHALKPWNEIGAGTKLYATPPATTGASTVLTDELIDAIMAKYSAFIAPGVYSLNSFECVEDVRSFAREVAAQAGQVAVPEWISVDERLPDAGHCLATYRNQHGKLRIIRAKYARQFEIDAGEDAIDQGNCEYNEADDTFYLKAGWLECIDNWDDYSSIYVTEGEVTHWMPLPAAPSPAKESK